MLHKYSLLVFNRGKQRKVGMNARVSFTSAAHAGDPHGFGMNPIDKLRYHGVFPCKLFLNLLILALTGVLLLVYEVPIAAYQHNQKMRLSSRFLPNSYVSINDDLTGISEVRELVRQTVAEYFGGLNDEVNKFSPISDMHGRARSPVMTASVSQRSVRFTRINDDDVDSSTVVSYLTPEKPLGLLDTELTGNMRFEQLPETRQQMDALCAPRLDWWSGDWYRPCAGYSSVNAAKPVAESMNNMKDDSYQKLIISFELVATDANVPFQSREASYLWKVVQTFDFHGGSGQVTAGVKLSGSRLGAPAAITLRELLAIGLLVCCIWDMCLRVRVFHRFRSFHAQHPFIPNTRDSYKLFGTEEDAVTITLEPSGVASELTAEAMAEEKAEEEEFTRWLLAAETRESSISNPRNSSRRSRHKHRRRTASRAHPDDRESTSPEQSQRTLASTRSLDAKMESEMSHHAPRSVHFADHDRRNGGLEKEHPNQEAGQAREAQQQSLLPGTPASIKIEPENASSSSTDSTWTTSSSYSSGSGEVSDKGLGFHSMSEKFVKDKATTEKREGKRRRLERRSRVINVNTMGGKWMVLGIVSELFLLAGCVFLLLDLHRGDESRALDLDHLRQILFGMGILLNSVLLLSYFRHSPRFYFLIEAMSRGMPRVFVFIVINVTPIFFSFVFFGVIVFGSFVSDLSSVSQASVSLVSVIGGDSLVRLLDTASSTNNFLLLSAARAYYISFICMFIYGVLNVTLAIVQDSYYFVKRKLYIMRDLEGKQALRDAYRNYKRQMKRELKSSTAMTS